MEGRPSLYICPALQELYVEAETNFVLLKKSAHVPKMVPVVLNRFLWKEWANWGTFINL